MTRLRLLAAVAAVLALPVASQGAIITFGAFLEGVQETPPNASLATGQVVLKYDDVAKTFDLALVAEGLPLAELTGAHIHLAPPGVPGSVIVNLSASQVYGAGVLIGRGIVGGSFPPANEADLLAENTYINLHSATYPGGEIRGQLVSDPVPEPMTIGVLGAGGMVLLGLRRRR